MSRVDDLKRAIENFHKTQMEFREFGAIDTEPSGVFRRLLMKAMDGRSININRTADQWDLYSSSMDCERAATNLNLAAQQCIEIISNCRIAESSELRKYVNDYCD